MTSPTRPDVRAAAPEAWTFFRQWLKNPLGIAALSPSGRQVAFSIVPRDDWEIYVIGSDGTGEQRERKSGAKRGK